MDKTPSPYYEGRKPFAERVDVITARSQLMEALAKVRSKVDAEFGIRQWTWLDKDPNKLFDPCDDLHEGAISIALGRGSPPVFPIMRGRVYWLSSRRKSPRMVLRRSLMFPMIVTI